MSLFLPSNLARLNGGRLGCRLAGMQEQQERLHFRKEQGSVKLLHQSSMYSFFLHRFRRISDLAGSKDPHENFICGDCDTGGGVPNLSLGAQYLYFLLLQQIG